jgi:hypothetical protein
VEEKEEREHIKKETETKSKQKSSLVDQPGAEADPNDDAVNQSFRSFKSAHDGGDANLSDME